MQKYDVGNNSKKKQMAKEVIREQQIGSLPGSENIETADLNEKAEKVEKCKNAATMIKEFEEIISTNKKSIICLAYQQGKVFRQFKEKEKFLNMVKEFKVNKSTMIFKMNMSS